jgi:hypothetical protein
MTESNSCNNNSSEETIEKAFELLKEAKALESSKEFWNATAKYIESHQILQFLADEATLAAASAAAAASNDDDNGKSKAEQEQIAKLYTTKANEYWSHSRQCLIKAMEQEKTKDDNTKNNGETTSLLSLLDDDQAQKRNHTFITLFSRPIKKEETITKTLVDDTGKDTTSVLDQQWSIEERLQELNKSLPSGFKTSEERMAEINKGLNKLGLSLYTQKEPFSSSKFHDTIPKSEEEQIDEIMAQAQDEAALDKQQMVGAAVSTTMKSNNYTNNDDSDSDDGDSDDDDKDEPGDELLEDDQLALKKIRKRIVTAQIKMVELVALLDEAKVANDKRYQQKEKEINVNNDDDDDDNDDSTKDEDGAVSNVLIPGKKKLKSARRDLKKALLQWEEDLTIV